MRARENLDIGLPVEQLRGPVRAQLTNERMDPHGLVLDPVKRRERPLKVRVTLTDIRDRGQARPPRRR